jgi:hypothetical protein
VHTVIGRVVERGDLSAGLLADAQELPAIS